MQRVGDRVGRGVGIAGRGRDPDDRADRRVFVHFVGRAVDIGHRSDVEFIDIVDVDREDLVGERSIALSRPHGDVAVAPSASRSIAPATVTIPVEESIANRPPSLSAASR